MKGVYIAELCGGVLKVGATAAISCRSNALERHSGARMRRYLWAGVLRGNWRAAEALMIEAAASRFQRLYGREWFCGGSLEEMAKPMLSAILVGGGVKEHAYLASVVSRDAMQLQRWLLKQLREQVAA